MLDTVLAEVAAEVQLVAVVVVGEVAEVVEEVAVEEEASK